MKHATLIGLLVLAGGIPLESHAFVSASGPGMGMHNATAMTGFATGIGASAANAGAGNNVSATAVGVGAGSASVTAVGPGSGTGNFSITIPTINFPMFTGFTLPEFTIPDIVFSGFPKITIPATSGAGGNESQQSGPGNVATQMNNHSTSIVQQGNGTGISNVIINNADQNQAKQNSVP